ncbi:unnamed protein product [Rotaria magnacalcarata]|uniref:MULE transposase domain-containing protein n=1 Tax=Rotaria magnacalcarata TaxID=392030 RepID=A0A816SKV7_9BILA|nr:unnamed protein product [Rotaria magnacalcarata]CAF4058892.1 unnamed protein product [Rotaria magnacalcarata]
MTTISNNGTTKNKPRLDHDGYSYIMDRSTREKKYWRCIKYYSDRCHSRLHTCIFTNAIIKPPSEHTCKIDGTTLEIRVFNEQIAHRAVNTQETPDTIITNCYKDISDPSIVRLPVRDNIKRRIRMLRHNNQVVKEANDPNFPSIPIQLTKTTRNDQFLRCDTGPGDDRILIFASDEQVDILQDTEEFLIDGTFKVVPSIFYQLFIIHGIFRDHAVPLIYALLRRKTKETYQHLIREILNIAPRWSPRAIMLDFEQASLGAFHAAFPHASLSGCYFHLRQSIHRKIQELGCQNQYQTDPIFAHNIHKIAALVFVEPNSVVNGFERLSIELSHDYDEIMDYFEGTYIGRLRSNQTRRKPMFEINFWNMHRRTTQSLMRTNNSAEAYNRRIGSVFQCAHPTLWVFLQKLINEETGTHADILQICAGQPPKKKKNNERYERRLINLLANPHRDISVQINSIAYNVSL